MNAIVQYIQNARIELKKVSWPNREETVKTTTLVVGVSLGVAAFLGALDYGLNRLLQFILERF